MKSAFVAHNDTHLYIFLCSLGWTHRIPDDGDGYTPDYPIMSMITAPSVYLCSHHLRGIKWTTTQVIPADNNKTEINLLEPIHELLTEEISEPETEREEEQDSSFPNTTHDQDSANDTHSHNLRNKTS